MKKTAIFINNFAGGGAEKVAHNLLSELVKKNHLTLIFLTHKLDYPIPENCSVIYLTKKVALNRYLKLLSIPIYAFKLLKVLKLSEIEILISFMEFQNWISCSLKFFNWHGKVLISEQVAPLQEYNYKTFGGKVGLTLNKLLYPKSDLIIPCSLGIKYQLENDLGIKSNYKVIYNPLNTNEANFKLKNSVGEQYNKFTFINVAGFRPQKNHTLLIDAFANLKSIDCQLILVGKDYENATIKLKKKCADLNISEKVKFIGYSDNPYQYLKNADCFVLSSDYEGLPNVLLEAMICGLPVISTDCPTGPREILSPNSQINKTLIDGMEIAEYGILSALKNIESLSACMKFIIQDKALRNHLQKKSIERATSFDLNIILNEYSSAIASN